MSGPTGFWKGIIRRKCQQLLYPDAVPPNPARAPATVGWTVSYWISATDATTALSRLDALNTAEMAMYTNDVVSFRPTVSDPGVRGDISGTGFATPFGTWVPNDSSLPTLACDPSLALAVRTSCAGLHAATRFLRGVGDGLVNTTERAQIMLDTNFGTAYAAWVKAVEVDAIQLVIGVDPSGNKTYTPFTITSVTPLATGKWYNMSIRRAGRPFDLRRGRRATC